MTPETQTFRLFDSGRAKTEPGRAKTGALKQNWGVPQLGDQQQALVLISGAQNLGKPSYAIANFKAFDRKGENVALKDAECTYLGKLIMSRSILARLPDTARGNR